MPTIPKLNKLSMRINSRMLSYAKVKSLVEPIIHKYRRSLLVNNRNIESTLLILRNHNLIDLAKTKRFRHSKTQRTPRLMLMRQLTQPRSTLKPLWLYTIVVKNL